MSENYDKVKEIIMDKLGVEENKITLEAKFIEDLGADSLDTVELIMQFEEDFNIEISDDDAEDIRSVVARRHCRGVPARGLRYDTDHPGASWIMAAKSPIEHVMVRFSEQEVSAMMNSDQLPKLVKTVTFILCLNFRFVSLCLELMGLD